MVDWKVLAVVVLGVSSQPAAAQEAGYNSGRSSGGDVYDATLNTVVTQAIQRDLSSIRSECAQAARVYRPDCVRQGLELTSRRIPFHGEYSVMRQALRQAAAGIAPAVSAHKDASLDRLEVDPDTNVRFRTRRYYTPVVARDLKDVTERSFAILQTCEAILLKSADRSTLWNKTYTAISISVSSLSTVLR
jgi:hypothetical protein